MGVQFLGSKRFPIPSSLPAPVGYSVLGSAANSGTNCAICPTTIGVAASRTVTVLCTGGRRDASTTSSGNVYRVNGGTNFLGTASTLGLIVTRTNAAGSEFTATFVALDKMQNCGIGAADAHHAIAALLITSGYSVKQRKFAMGVSASPAVTFDTPVAASREVIVCLHHADIASPVLTPPAGSVLLTEAFTLGPGGTRQAGIKVYQLPSMTGLSVVPGLTLDTSRAWGYQAIEYGI